MLRHRYIICLMIILLAFLLYYIDANYSQTVIGAINNAKINYSQIIHIKEVKDGAIVFYETEEDNFEIGYVKKTFVGWYWVSDGGGRLKKSNPQSWIYTNRKIGKTSYPVCFGSVQNSAIQNVYYNIINSKEGVKITENSSAEIIREYAPAILWYILLGEADLQFQNAEITVEDVDTLVVNLYVKRKL